MEKFAGGDEGLSVAGPLLQFMAEKSQRCYFTAVLVDCPLPTWAG